MGPGSPSTQGGHPLAPSPRRGARTGLFVLCPAFLALFSFFFLLLHPGDGLSNLSIYGQEVRSSGRVRGRRGPWGGTRVPCGGQGPWPPLGCVGSWGTPRRCLWDPHGDALCHWDPHPGWWLGSPSAPPRVLEHPELLQRVGEKTAPAGGEGFFLLFYHFILKPNAAGLGVRLQQPVPPPGGEGEAGCVPSPRPPRSH